MVTVAGAAAIISEDLFKYGLWRYRPPGDYEMIGHGEDVSSDALFQAAEAGDEISTRRLPKLSHFNAVGGDRRTSVELTSKLQVIQVLAEHGLDPTSKRTLAKLSHIKAVGDDRRTSVELTSKLQVVQMLAEHGLDPTSEACGRALANGCGVSNLDWLSAIAG
jgi:hypothetical protein